MKQKPLYTFGDLLDALKDLTPEQLAKDITYFDEETEEMFAMQYGIEFLNEKDENIGDILDHGHPYFVKDFC
jgi:hypothetical protein